MFAVQKPQPVRAFDIALYALNFERITNFTRCFFTFPFHDYIWDEDGSVKPDAFYEFEKFGLDADM